MHYSPWTGWGFGFNYNFGWFNFGIGNYSPWSYYGGWWGPAIYRPSYCWTPYRGGYHGGYYGGYYGRRNTVVINNNINIYRNNNIYNRRTGVIGTRDNRRIAAAYPRNASPARSERYGNARPVERRTTRNTGNYDNSRPAVGRTARPANSPRTVAPPAGSNPAASGSTRPTRTFDRSSQTNRTSPSQATSPSRRVYNEGAPQARPQPSGQNRSSVQQPVRSSSSNISRQPRTIERTAPVQRSIQAARQPAQRVERSSAPSRSAGGAERAPRQAGGERRAGRG